MHEIIFYEDSGGKVPVYDYLQELSRRSDKSSRIKFNKIQEYIQVLEKFGTIGEPYTKHLDGDIWELRPIKDRILFVAVHGDSFLLLHVFQKKTQKTPRGEIAKAKREYADYLERECNHE